MYIDESLNRQRSDGLWRFACGNVCLCFRNVAFTSGSKTPNSSHDKKLDFSWAQLLILLFQFLLCCLERINIFNFLRNKVWLVSIFTLQPPYLSQEQFSHSSANWVTFPQNNLRSQFLNVILSDKNFKTRCDWLLF